MIRLNLRYFECGRETSHTYVDFHDVTEAWNWVNAHYPDFGAVPTFKHPVTFEFPEDREKVELSLSKMEERV